MNKKILKAFKNPILALNIAKDRINTKLGRVDFVGAIGNRSVSDSGPYVASIQKALSNYKN